MMHVQFTRSYRGPLKGVILDWARTTLDYGCCASALVFAEVFKRRGVAEVQMPQRGSPGYCAAGE